MKRFISFIVIITIIIISYILIFTLPRNYEMTYEKDNVKVKEKYEKDKKTYSFDIDNEGVIYHFLLPIKYTNSRKIVDKVEVINNDTYVCVRINVNDNQIAPQCYNGEEYVDAYISDWKEYKSLEPDLLYTYENVEVYNNDYKFYVWNQLGLTDLIKKKKYHFLANESYNNTLYYVMDEQIIFADYDQKREISNFYIFSLEDGSVEKWKTNEKISKASYFMGNDGELLYLFDKKSVKQYELNLKKREIKVVSNGESLKYYDGEWQDAEINQFIYNEKTFVKDSFYTYSLKDNKLYLHTYGSDSLIRVSDRKVRDILYSNDEIVYYVVGDSVYCYNMFDGEKLLMTNFEWNFSYKDKIFIFN